MEHLAVLGLTAACLGSAAPRVTHQRVRWRYRDTVYDYGQYKVENRANAYTLEIGQTHPPGRPARTYIGMREPVYWANFLRGGFLSFTLNGIPMAHVEPVCRHGSGGRRAGVDARFNVDGIRVSVRLFMTRADEPLWIAFRVDNPRAKPITDLSLRLVCYPGTARRRKTYQRMLVTPKQTVAHQTRCKTFQAAPDEDWFFAADEEYDVDAGVHGSAGPCFVMFRRADVARLTVSAGNAQAVVFNLRLDPATREVRFGLWEHMRPMGNKEALTHLRAQVDAWRRWLAHGDFTGGWPVPGP